MAADCSRALRPLGWVAVGLGVCLAAAAPGAAAAASDVEPEPRAYGYFVGDRLQRRIPLDLADGFRPDLASLSLARRPGQALELRGVQLQGSTLVLDYQVFLAPEAVRTLELAPLQLRLVGPKGERSQRIEAWPVTVAPLVPKDVSPRNGLGEMQPDQPPPLVDTGALRLRLQACAAALALALLYLAQVYLAAPWWGRRQRPFAQAWRVLRALREPSDATPPRAAASASASATAAARRAAFNALHQALDRSAGHAVFAQGLPAFLAAQPRFAPLQAELAQFFQHSADEFFGRAGSHVPLSWLQGLGRACRDAERGSA